MVTAKYNVIGVMSGTSLDGLDVAYINFTYKDSWDFKIIKAETIAYPKQWIDTLKNLVLNSFDELKSIDVTYTGFLASVIIDFIERNEITNIDAICSHGHTALHQPEKGLTCQIGNRKELSQLTGKPIVCDFRVQDVAFGGQGAPLVPIGDELLFPKFDYCINLGGFANLSTKLNSVRIAYDICPVNIVLNHYANTLGLNYDDHGSKAALGNVNEALLSSLNQLEFYEQKPPKSLGLEWVKETIFPVIESYNLKTEDVLRTFVEHIAHQITKNINTSVEASILITGGGVYNSFLVDRITSQTKNNVIIPSKDIINYKEALIFGLLGVLRLRNENNCLSSVTGASKNHSSGKVFQV